jgi:hypothetical protein
LKKKMSSKSAIDKLRAISGIDHAIDIVDEYCNLFAIDDVIELAGQ